MTLHQLYPAALPFLPRLETMPTPRRLAAAWWRMLRTHVAERHFLPRPPA